MRGAHTAGARGNGGTGARHRGSTSMPRRTIVAGMAPLAAALAAACGPLRGAPTQPAGQQPRSTPAEIKFFSNHGVEDVPLFEEVLAQFRTKVPEIRVEFSNVTGNYHDFRPVNNKYIGEALAGQRPVREALADLEREANIAIAKYEPRWLQRDQP